MVGHSDKERSFSFGLGDGSRPFGTLLLCQGCERHSLQNSDPSRVGRIGGSQLRKAHQRDEARPPEALI
jgi:hypothetical protein